jgi:hypothetical protein
MTTGSWPGMIGTTEFAPASGLGTCRSASWSERRGPRLRSRRGPLRASLAGRQLGLVVELPRADVAPSARSEGLSAPDGCHVENMPARGAASTPGSSVTAGIRTDGYGIAPTHGRRHGNERSHMELTVVLAPDDAEVHALARSVSI